MNDILLNNDFSIVEGIVKKRSSLPDIEKSDYDDCRYSVEMEIFFLSEGVKVPHNIIVLFPGFENKKYDIYSNVQVGEKFSCKLFSYESLPMDIKSTQVADDLEDFEKEYYWATDIKKIEKFSKISNDNDYKKEKREIDIIEPLEIISMEIRAKRDHEIKSDLSKVTYLMEKHNNDTDKWCKELKPIYDKIKDEDCNCEWIEDSIAAAVPIKRDTPPNTQNRYNHFVDQMLELKNFFDQYNIDLILLKMPEKYEVWADYFLKELYPEDGVLRPHDLEITQLLLKNNIEVLTFDKEIIEKRSRYCSMFFYNLKGERHPCEGVERVMAEKIAKRLQRYSFPKDSLKYSLKETTGMLRSLVYPKGNDKYKEGTQVPFFQVVDENGVPLSIVEDGNSPIVIVTNSMSVYPNIKKSASLAHYLAYELGVKPDIVYRDGSIAPINMLFQKRKSYLSQRRVIIYMLPSFESHPKILLNPSQTTLPLDIIDNSEKVAYFDADNFMNIPKIEEVSDLVIENGVIKISFNKPIHSRLRLGNFLGKEFVVRVCFAHLQNTRCFLTVSSWPYSEKEEVSSSDGEKTVDLYLKTDRDKNDIIVNLSGTQYIKDITIYKIK